MKLTPTRLRLRVLTLGVLVAATFTASGVPIVPIPTGLNPGDQYRLAFVTDTLTTAIANDIAYYNAFVQAEADAVAALSALGATWNAIGSTITPRVDAKVNTGTDGTEADVPIYTLADGIIAANNSDLWDGTIGTPINVTPSGLVLGREAVWTGSVASGEIYFKRTLDENGPEFGQSDRTTSEWIQFAATPPNGSLRVYGMSSLLTVPSAPAPEAGTTLLLLGCSLIALVGLKRKI